jgi:hypothetical protein
MTTENSEMMKNFRPLRNNVPEKDDIICSYTAVAYFVNGQFKKSVVENLMTREQGSNVALSQMVNLANARHKEAIECLKEILMDLEAGMSLEMVLMKEYKFIIEAFYYTKPEYVPQNDLHWKIINIKNMEDFVENNIKMKVTNERGEELDLDVLEMQVQSSDECESGGAEGLLRTSSVS